MSRSVMEELVQYIAEARTRELPSAVLEKTRHHVLDTFAAMVSGTQLKPGKLAIAYAGRQGGPAEAQVAGTRLRVSAINAALANGMLAHADETDDAHPQAAIHPGCAIVPAALAMAERENANGAEFLRAVALGYDISCRTIKALSRAGLKARNHLTFGIGGTMGASAAAGCLAGLQRERIAHLLSYGAQQAGGMTTYPRDTEHIEKAFTFGGMPARNGVTAAAMVASEFTGVDDVFSGDGNFLAAYAEKPRPEELVAELGSRYEIMHTNIKKYCVGFPIQLPLEGLLLIMKEHNIRAQDVQHVVARIDESGAHTVNDREMPDINLQYIFAVTLLDGDLSFAAAHSIERMQDPQVLRVKARVSLVADPELKRALPPLPQRQAIVEVVTIDSRRISKRVTSFRGLAEDPLSTVEVQAKALELIEPVLGASKTRTLIEMAGRLESVASMREFARLLAAP